MWDEIFNFESFVTFMNFCKYFNTPFLKFSLKFCILIIVGQPIHCITGTKLPLRDRAAYVTKEVMTFWDKARIPTAQERNVISRIKTVCVLEKPTETGQNKNCNPDAERSCFLWRAQASFWHSTCKCIGYYNNQGRQAVPHCTENWTCWVYGRYR